MAVKPVLRMGHPLLWRRAQPIVAEHEPWLESLLQDLRDTMQALDGAGLAAPQIGESVQVVIFGGAFNPRYPEAPPIPPTVLINPVLTPLSDEMEEGWEGCLSLPGLRGLVPRYRHLRYQGRDEKGALIDRSVSGFHARVVQHECDHLLGILYPMRMRDLTHFGFQDQLFPPESPAPEAG